MCDNNCYYSNVSADSNTAFFAVVVAFAMVFASVFVMVVVASAFVVVVATATDCKNCVVVSYHTAHVLSDHSVAVEIGLLHSAGCGKKKIDVWR